MADVQLKNIRKSFARQQVLHGVTLDVASGEFVSLLGASGCGKTTLLRILAGLERVTAGTVAIGGSDVTDLPPEKRDIAMMFQSYALLPHLPVYENVRFPLRMRRIGAREEQDARVRSALETVQLGHLADRRPRQLSGGQQQRVALARAIVSNPRVLLLDEPLSNLDARLREDMQVELIEIHKRLGLTTLFVTHDQEEALSLSDRVVLLNAGRIEQEGPPGDIYARPRTGFASTFLGSANMIDVDIVEEADMPMARIAPEVLLPLAAGEQARGPATVILRQEDITLSGSPPGVAATVRTRVFLGARNRYVLTLGDRTIRALTPHDVVFPDGGTVFLTIPPARARIIDS